MGKDDPVPQPPAHTRRPHRKSKTGCKACRLRRVKCNEARPKCSACVRREETCRYQDSPAKPSPQSSTHHSPIYQHEAPLHTRLQPDSPRAAPSCAVTPTHEAPQVSSNTFHISDLALLHHWTVTVSRATCQHENQFCIWGQIVPEIGFEQPFVTYAILSLAALHRAREGAGRERPSFCNQYVRLAIEYHNIGLRGFNDAVAQLCRQNSEAIFVWSFLNIVYTFAVSALSSPALITTPGASGPGSSPSESLSDRVERVLGIEWLPMVSGVSTVVDTTREYLATSRVAPMLDVGNYFEIDIPSPAEDNFIKSLKVARESWASSGDVAVYDETCSTLERCWAFTKQFADMDERISHKSANRGWSGCFMFVNFAPKAYWTLLHQRQPQALILFAHYGALTHQADNCWFLEGLGKEMVEVATDLIGSYWKDVVSWPSQAVASESGRQQPKPLRSWAEKNANQ